MLDWVVLAAYVGGVTALGLRVSRGVGTTGDYFMGGRRFGRVLMVAQAFGTGTRTDQVVAVSGGAAQVGLAAIWFQWLYLFSTPFYWLLAPVYRRLRYITIGDFFERRYGAVMGAVYASVGLLYFAVSTGVMLRGAGITASAITGGVVSLEAAVLGIVAFFVAYSLLGGLVAAVVTQAVQGLFILLLSFLLIPFALSAAGGLGGVRAALPEGQAWFSLVATEEVTLFYIVMAVVNALVGVTVQPHHMAINGAGKDERSCRTGWTYGNFVKRFATLGWAFTGVFIAALFPLLRETDRGTREAAFGLAARELLPAGVTGLLLAAVIAAVVACASAFMVNGSALFTRNFYRRYMRPQAPEPHYLLVGRVSSLVVVAAGVMFALGLESVISGLEWIWRLMAFLGIAFWAAICWRRANRYGAWASVAVTALLAMITNGFGWSFPAQIALYLPAGFLAMVLVSLVTRPEPETTLNAFYSLLNTPVGEEDRLVEAGIEIIHESAPAVLSASVAANAPVAVDAPAGEGHRDGVVHGEGREHSLLRIAPDQESALSPSAAPQIARVPPLLDDEPAARRGASLLLVNLTRLGQGFSLDRYRDDLGGFALAWAIVVALIALAGLLAWIVG